MQFPVCRCAINSAIYLQRLCTADGTTAYFYLNVWYTRCMLENNNNGAKMSPLTGFYTFCLVLLQVVFLKLLQHEVAWDTVSDSYKYQPIQYLDSFGNCKTIMYLAKNDLLSIAQNGKDDNTKCQNERDQIRIINVDLGQVHVGLYAASEPIVNSALTWQLW